MEVNIHQEPWCEMCPFVVLIVNKETLYADDELAAVPLTAQCYHLEQCRAAVKRAEALERKKVVAPLDGIGWTVDIPQPEGSDCPAPQWISVDDSLPDPGELVLCAMWADGVWLPRWGYRVDRKWRVVIRMGCAGSVPLDRLTHWMRIPPPTPMKEVEETAMRETQPDQTDDGDPHD